MDGDKPRLVPLNTKIWDYQKEFLNLFSGAEEKTQADVVRAMLDYFMKEYGDAEHAGGTGE